MKRIIWNIRALSELSLVALVMISPVLLYNLLDSIFGFREISTLELLETEKLVAIVEPANKENPARRYCDERILERFSTALRNSRHSTSTDDFFLPAANRWLTLEFERGETRAICIGERPDKISACQIVIDKQSRVVLSPGLPDLPRGWRHGPSRS